MQSEVFKTVIRHRQFRHVCKFQCICIETD